MKWSTINYLFNSMVVKILTFFSILAIFVGVIKDEKIQSLLFFPSIGVIVFLVTYLIFILLVPDEIKIYTLEEYIELMEKKEKEKRLSQETEFSFLNKKENIGELYVFKNEFLNIKEFKNLDEFIKYNSEDYIEQLSIIKYGFINVSKTVWRWFISILFFISVLFLYLNSLLNMYNLIYGELIGRGAI